ncbi:MAG TPA: peptide deformylase [Bacillota bacterium]|nr:peptide deformylase [Bacillota bacterium]HPZ21662.1 peptide deformylase [Bacillota bacterium]HQD19500.1 peptide deformylase [Bacillota bacterium]
MAVREIRKLGDPVLRKKAQRVKKIDAGIVTLLEDMAETMEHYKGVGLAAPQVGHSLALVVVRPGEDFPVFEFINPEILSCSGEETDLEGCLSCPGTYGQVTRCTELRLKYQNRRGETKYLDAAGYFARILQHELDHLAGILFVDKATDLVSGEE